MGLEGQYEEHIYSGPSHKPGSTDLRKDGKKNEKKSGQTHHDGASTGLLSDSSLFDVDNIDDDTSLKLKKRDI